MKDEVFNSHEDNVVEFSVLLAEHCLLQTRGFANYGNKKKTKQGFRS